MVGARRTSLMRLLGIFCALVTSAAILPAAGVSAPAKPFTAAFAAPATFVPGTSGTWHYTITDADHNGVPSSQVLGSAHITIPLNWNVTSVLTTGPAGTSWTAGVVANQIALDASTNSDRLAGGQSLDVAITATPACGASSPSQWPIAVKQSNNFLGAGNDFFLDGSTPTLTSSATPGPLASFTVSTSPSPATAGQSFTVKAIAYDTCGRVKTDYAPSGLTPTGTLGNSTKAPASDLTGVTPVYDAFTWSNGVGMAPVTPKKAETGQTVTITDGAVTKTSDAFDVVPGPLSPKFVNQPGDTQISQTIYSDVAAQTPVTVNVSDPYGNPAPNGTPVTMTSAPIGVKGNGNPPSAVTSGGVASFSGANSLHIDSLGTYTLSANAGVGPADTSSPFDIVTTLKVCDNVNKCTAPASNGNIQSADTAMSSTTATNFSGAVLESTFELPPGGGCGVSPIAGTLASEVSVRASTDPDLSDTKPTFTITYTISKATLKAAGLDNFGAAHFRLCLGAKPLDPNVNTGWVDASGNTTTLGAAGFYWGFVPSASPSLPANNPYIASQKKNGAGDLVIVLVKPYPWDGCGYGV